MNQAVKIIVASLLAAFVFAIPVQASQRPIGVFIDGVPVEFPGGTGPTIVNERTMVPIRGVFEALGFEVDWYAELQTAALRRSDFMVLVGLDRGYFMTNNVRYELEVPAALIDGRTMLPIRDVLESVGMYVGWDAETSSVLVFSPIAESVDVPEEAHIPEPEESIPDPTPEPLPEPVPLPEPLPPTEQNHTPLGRPAVEVEPGPERDLMIGTRYEPFAYTRSNIVLPDRRLTNSERNEWILEYFDMGGPSAFETEVIRLINLVRAEHGRSPVQMDYRLMMAARFYTQQKANLDVEIGSNRGPYSVERSNHGASYNIVRAFGGRLRTTSGSPGVGYWEPEAFVTHLMSLAPHRNFVLNPEHRFIGVGSHLGGRFGVFQYLHLSMNGSTNPVDLSRLEHVPVVDVREFEQRVFELTNQERVNNGLEPLLWNEEIAHAARVHSQDMADGHGLHHEGSDDSTPRERMSRYFHRPARVWLENIYSGTNITPEHSIQRWIGSPDHRNNMNNPEARYIGVGVVVTRDGTIYVSQKFIG